MLRAASIGCSIAVIAGVLLAASASADVFKFVDEKGNVQYTDRPQKLPAQRLNIQTQRTDVVELDSRAAAEMRDMNERAKARGQTQQSSGDQQRAAETSAASKAEACAKAREDYRVRSASTRMYEENAGERRYLEPAEADAARDASKKLMDELCAGQ